jgi:hypothetical protein
MSLEQMLQRHKRNPIKSSDYFTQEQKWSTLQSFFFASSNYRNFEMNDCNALAYLPGTAYQSLPKYASLRKDGKKHYYKRLF